MRHHQLLLPPLLPLNKSFKEKTHTQWRTAAAI
jgi:hypothetical protein